MKRSEIYLILTFIFIMIYCAIVLGVVFNYFPLQDLTFENMCWIVSPVPFILLFASLYLIRDRKENGK